MILWTAACQASLSITKPRSLLRLKSIKSVMPSNHLILCRPLLLLPSTFPSRKTDSLPVSQFFALGVQSIGALASASVLPINIQDWFPLGLTGLISLYMTFKSLLQHHGSKASILQHSAIFIVQLSYPYMITGETIALTRQTLVHKMMSPAI